MIDYQRVVRAENPQLVESGPKLSGKAKVGGSAAAIPNHHSQLIQHFASTEIAKAGTLVGLRYDFVQFVIKELRQLGDAMADDVMQQLTGQLPDPMVAAAQYRTDIVGVAQIIRKMAFQMDRLSAQKPLLHKPTHFKRLKRELKIMSRSQLQIEALCQANQFLGLISRHSERLLNVGMATRFETLPCERKMALAAGW